MSTNDENPLIKAAVVEIILEKELDLPTEYVNDFIKKLCEHPDLTSELNKVETNKIKMRNKSIQII